MRKLVAAFMVVIHGFPLVAQESPYDSRQMHEDVATLKLLLNRAITQTYAIGHSSELRLRWHTPGRLQPGAMSPPLVQSEELGLTQHHDALNLKLDGHALADYGVVFSATLPQPLTDPVHSHPTGKKKVLSDWERAQRQLRGELEQAAKTELTLAPPSLADALLTVLAKNGQHLSLLKPEDRVTISISFSQQSCAQCHQVQSSRAKHTMLDPLTSPGTAPSPTLVPKADMGGLFPGMQKTEESSQMLLGELHYKQGRYQEAILAYQKALELQRGKTGTSSKPKNGQQMRASAQVIEILNRLAQLYLKVGDRTKAKTALEAAAKAQHLLIDELAGKKKTERSTGMELPRRLVITATKQLLDDVGKGKITYDVLRQKVSVKLLDFSQPKKK